jgi:hypothetical protein
MEFKVVMALTLGDGFYSVLGEIWKLVENDLEKTKVELECTFGLNVGMVVEVARLNVAECFEVVPQN